MLESISIEDYMKEIGIPKKYRPILNQRDGFVKILERLQRDIPLKDVAVASEGQKVWELIGHFYRNTKRPHQAIWVYKSLYERMFIAQAKARSWRHKAMPLVWMADLYKSLGYNAHARRYAMLTLCEDAIRDHQDQGQINIEEGGTYFRLAWHYGMPDQEIHRYAKEAFDAFNRLRSDGWFPERLLLEVDNHWMIDVPTPQEVFHYVINPHFVNQLLTKLGRSQGKGLEILARYILSCIPGVRTYGRWETPSTDYDVVCAIEGMASDFRDELGRYMICECKDWKRSVDFSTIAKFCRVLDSAKCKAGILLSRKAISGTTTTTNASRERLKVYQDRGLVILCLSLEDFHRIKNGENLIALLRARYEIVRLDKSE